MAERQSRHDLLGLMGQQIPQGGVVADPAAGLGHAEDNQRFEVVTGKPWLAR